MIRIEIDAENVIELKEQLKELLNEPIKNTVTVTLERVTVAAPQIKEVKAPKAKKAEPAKEEPVKTAVAANELTEDQKTELRTLCAEYTHKVADLMAHAILSASASSRWLHCTPSARLERKFPDVSSPYAEACLAGEKGQQDPGCRQSAAGDACHCKS